jgi:glycerate kinase
VLDAVGFDAAAFDLVVTGEGRVDATTALGKAPGEVVRRAGATRCVVFGGVVDEVVPGAETVALSGDPARARDDLAALGRELAAGGS